MSANDFGAWLGRQLHRAGMSQADLAHSLDVTRAAVSAWVTGRAEPRKEKLEQIERLLGLDSGTSASRTEIADSFSPVRWFHRPGHPDGGREFGDTAAFAFTSDPRVLAREATQNSIDERLRDSEPVRVRYVLEELTGEPLHDFLDALRWEALRPHFEQAVAGAGKVGRVLESGLDELERSGSLTLLRIDDYNASGLTGPEYDDGKFAAVIRRQLDSRKSATAGGSYGLGKATLWSASRFGLVLINSRLSTPVEGHRSNRLIGRLNLPWHEVGGESFAGPAWFGRRDEAKGEVARSWWGDDETVERLRLKREGSAPGTSFLIVGAHDPTGEASSIEDLKEMLVEGLASAFWPSMVAADGQGAPPLLEATVVTRRNGYESEERVDPHTREPARSRAVRAYLNGSTVSARTRADDVLRVPVPLKVPALRGVQSSGVEHEAVLLVTAAEGENSNRLVRMRGNRMVVTDKRFYDAPIGAEPFEAVLLAGTAADGDPAALDTAERFLRAAEPPEHNDWRATEDLTASYARGAATRIKEFRKAVNDLLRASLQPAEGEASPTPKALRELLRLDPPPPPRSPGHPTVIAAEGAVAPDGAWRLRVEVKLPERADPWVMRPVLRFATRSGPRPRIAWSELIPVSECTRSGDRLEFAPGARRAVFEGISAVTDHPVDAGMAMIEVDLERGTEGTE